MKEETATTKTHTTTAHRLAYFIYLILVVYHLCIGDYEWAISNFGIALVFDPFDSSVKWQHRPMYQKVWLFTHLTLLTAGFVFLIIL